MNKTKAGKKARRQVVKHIPHDGHVDVKGSKHVQSLTTEAEQRSVKSRGLQGSKEEKCIPVTCFSTPAPIVR